MSDPIQHECGVAIVRLRKPLSHYHERYGSAAWGLSKLYLLMEKQRNRGQDGAGMAACKLDMPPGAAYMERLREAGSGSLDRLWAQIHHDLSEARRAGAETTDQLKQRCPWLGEILLGHLRYGTHGGNNVHVCHPMVRTSNWSTRRIMTAGNFNLTNTGDLLQRLVDFGQHPVADTDTLVVMEKIAYFLDEANNAIVRKLKSEQGLYGAELSARIADELDMARVLRNASKTWDGGYTMCGIVGHGLTFVLRDPAGIRPAYWLANDEVLACASERAALVTCFNVAPETVQEVPPGQVLLCDHHGNIRLEVVSEPLPKKSCSFERIYFSRGNDQDIYRERKALGRELVPALVATLGEDLPRAVLSYVPNTAEVSYIGLMQGLGDYWAGHQEHAIWQLQQQGKLTREALADILAVRPRLEKAAHKDAKLRTFISDDSGRNELVAHAYDISRGVLEPGKDTLVLVDDSIVRGTTLRESLLRIMLRLKPKRIVVCSSAPQIRYPDCYGIDMSELGRFVAFEACVSLLREQGKGALLDEVYRDCQSVLAEKRPITVNHVQRLYAECDDLTISARIATLVTPSQVDWECPIEVVFQSVGGLRRACPEHTGDWYFTGNYPTPGGFRVVNQALVNYMEKRGGRAY